MADMILAPASSWQAALARPSDAFMEEVARLRDEDTDEARKAIRWYLGLIEGALKAFKRDADDDLAVIRSPGRVNLLGTHIDHRGGRVNPIAVRELALVAMPREDTVVRIANADPKFPRDEFDIADLLPDGPIDNWTDWTLSTTPRMLKDAGLLGHWGSYVRAACAYFSNVIGVENLKGFDLYVDTQLPPSAGLSSSSALVVGTAIALHLSSGIEYEPLKLAQATGDAEWYAGARGGSGDQAAILLGKSGHVSHIDFFPMKVSWSPWPEGYSVMVAHSRTAAQKTANARSTFNERVATYGIAQLWMLRLHPEWAPKIVHFRDFLRLNLRLEEIYRVLGELPSRATRAEIEDALPKDRLELEKLFSTHDEPKEGYRVRDVCLYGLAEMLRADRFAEYLRDGDIVGAGMLLDLSHEGDRVSQYDELDDRRVPVDTGMPGDELESLIFALGSEDEFMLEAADLAQQSGGYACSSYALDEIVDIARQVDGVVGAGLIGAGIGGCVEIIVENDSVEDLHDTLLAGYYEAHGRDPFIEVMRPVEGAGPIPLQ